MNTHADSSFLGSVFDTYDKSPNMQSILTVAILSTLFRNFARGVKVHREALDAVARSFVHVRSVDRDDILEKKFSLEFLQHGYRALFLCFMYSNLKSSIGRKMRAVMSAAFLALLGSSRMAEVMPVVAESLFSRHGLQIKVTFPGEQNEERLTLQNLLKRGLLQARQFSPDRVFWTWCVKNFNILFKNLGKEGVTLAQWISAPNHSLVEKLLYTRKVSSWEKIERVVKSHLYPSAHPKKLFGKLLAIKACEEGFEHVSEKECHDMGHIVKKLMLHSCASDWPMYKSSLSFIHLLLRGLLTRPNIGPGRFERSFMDDCELDSFMVSRGNCARDAYGVLLLVPILRFKLRILFSSAGPWGKTPVEIRNMIMVHLYETCGVNRALQRFCFCGRPRHHFYNCIRPQRCKALAHMGVEHHGPVYAE